MSDEIRVGKGKKYNIDAMRREKQRIKDEKAKGLVLIDGNKIEYDQEVIELIDAENEQRRDNFEDLDTQLYNLDRFIEDYSTLPLEE